MKNTAYETEIAIVPPRKLHTANRRMSTIRFRSASFRITKNMRLTAAITASVRITGEPNQSRSLPLSSMICSVAPHTISDIWPTLSMESLRTCVSRSR
ncbi:hypothetical protein KEC55_32675 [Burkholderia cepacia]|nr:hypothetical protein KEC55_32675 [Burkholderia cepacia]